MSTPSPTPTSSDAARRDATDSLVAHYAMSPVPSPHPDFRPWLHRYAVLLAVATVILLSAGGQVTSNSAGLSVPDWPTSFGENMFLLAPSKWIGGIFWEHSHRLIASTVGFLTIGLAVFLWRVERRRWMRWLGVAALGAVIAQGALGGLTVLLLLPDAVSIAHACLAQLFFCTVVSIAVFTSRRWLTMSRRSDAPGGTAIRRAAIVCAAMIFCQLILGALVRHTESALAVPDFPKAYGQWLPSLDAASIEKYNQQRRWDLGLPVVERHQVIAHVLHRGGALLVAAAVAWAAIRALRSASISPSLIGPAILLVVLTLAQGTLGAATVLTGRAPLIATGHQTCGALLLATSIVLLLRAHRAFAAPSTGRERSMPSATVVAA